VVNVPFSDRTGVKPRPALVVSANTFHRAIPDLIVCPISSRLRYYHRPGPGDCPIREWRAVGFRHPSTVRISKLLAVDKQIVKRILGSLPSPDLALVETELRQAFGFK
jgi:mRNA-degrading endonuclease toxin of MazEF toxin-antitoxin module